MQALAAGCQRSACAQEVGARSRPDRWSGIRPRADLGSGPGPHAARLALHVAAKAVSEHSIPCHKLTDAKPLAGSLTLDLQYAPG